MSDENELERVRRTYEGYDSDGSRSARYSLDNPGNRAILQERWGTLADLIARAAVAPKGPGRVLEIGCGAGGNLETLGASGGQVFGADLSLPRLARASSEHPGSQLVAADGSRLPFPSGVFTVVALFTVISSVRDLAVARGIASESLRVLAPDGFVLWYDLRIPNPQNPNVRGIPRREIRALFPGTAQRIRSVTLLPQLARRLGRATRFAYPVLGRLPLLRSHLAGVLVKRGKLT